jgi:hypothetical protein
MSIGPDRTIVESNAVQKPGPDCPMERIEKLEKRMEYIESLAGLQCVIVTPETTVEPLPPEPPANVIRTGGWMG